MTKYDDVALEDYIKQNRRGRKGEKKDSQVRKKMRVENLPLKMTNAELY